MANGQPKLGAEDCALRCTRCNGTGWASAARDAGLEDAPILVRPIGVFRCPSCAGNGSLGLNIENMIKRLGGIRMNGIEAALATDEQRARWLGDALTEVDRLRHVLAEAVGVLRESENERAPLTQRESEVLGILVDALRPVTGDKDANGLRVFLAWDEASRSGVAFADRDNALFSATGVPNAPGAPVLGEGFRDACAFGNPTKQFPVIPATIRVP